jgi:hypothetical protein
MCSQWEFFATGKYLRPEVVKCAVKFTVKMTKGIGFCAGKKEGFICGLNPPVKAKK